MARIEGFLLFKKTLRNEVAPFSGDDTFSSS
jgi:hypothetical protein